MDTELGRLLILWTVRISVALYVVAVWRFVFGRRQKAADAVYVVAWSLSWLLCIVHVLCAFHFQHHWSHSAALRHTAEMTDKVVNIYWSGGLYVNYIFLTLWAADVVRTLRSAGTTSAIVQKSSVMHTVAAFMMFNATVVFGPRWWIIPVGLLLAALAWNIRRRIGAA